MVKSSTFTLKLNVYVPSENMCSRLSDIANGRVVFGGTFVGATANYSCDTGYNLLGNAQRVCQSSGKWTGSIPTCESE